MVARLSFAPGRGCAISGPGRRMPQWISGHREDPCDPIAHQSRASARAAAAGRRARFHGVDRDEHPRRPDPADGPVPGRRPGRPVPPGRPVRPGRAVPAGVGRPGRRGTGPRRAAPRGRVPLRPGRGRPPRAGPGSRHRRLGRGRRRRAPVHLGGARGRQDGRPGEQGDAGRRRPAGHGPGRGASSSWGPPGRSG